MKKARLFFWVLNRLLQKYNIPNLIIFYVHISQHFFKKIGKTYWQLRKYVISYRQQKEIHKPKKRSEIQKESGKEKLQTREFQNQIPKGKEDQMRKEKKRKENKKVFKPNPINSKKYLVEDLERTRVPWRRMKNLRSRGMSERNKADISWWSQRASQISNLSKIIIDYFRHSCDKSTKGTAKQKKRSVPANVLQYKKSNKQNLIQRAE